jgi:hypothetical protein
MPTNTITTQTPREYRQADLMGASSNKDMRKQACQRH